MSLTHPDGGPPAAPHDGGAKALSLVVVSGGALEWGVPAAVVRVIANEPEWTGSPPLDLAAALGLGSPKGGEQYRRILVLGAHQGEVAISAAGKISLREVDADAIAPLPPLAMGGRHAKVFAGVILGEGQGPLFILNVSATSSYARGSR